LSPCDTNESTIENQEVFTMKTILTTTMIALALPAFAYSQSAITGKWQGQTKSGTRIVLDVKGTTTTLTGTLTQDEQTAMIADGKVSKNTITFKATFNGRTDGFTGALVGDQMSVQLDRLGPASAAVLKRVVDVKRDGQANLTGRWQGTTPSGQPLVLDLNVAGQLLTGRLTLAQRPADITEGKVDGQTFSLIAGALDGRPIVAKGRLVSEELELTVQGVGSPLTLKRVK
jgi:hypothetical protein